MSQLSNDVIFKPSVEVLTASGNWEPIKHSKDEFVKLLHQKWEEAGGPDPKSFIEGEYRWHYPLRFRESCNWEFLKPIEFTSQQ